VPWLFELYLGALLLLIVALCYKMFALGILGLALLALGGWTARENLKRFNVVLLISLLYIADATVTAFFVSSNEGLLRSAQFVFIAAGLVGFFAYSWNLSQAQVQKGLKWIAIISAVIFAHLIAYHMYIGRYNTWKYLADTKTIISMMVFLCFALKDQISRRVPFAVPMIILAALIVMSAERKALLLFAVAALFSTLRWSTKVSVLVFAPLALLLVALSGLDGGFLQHKFEASSASLNTVSDRYFMTVESIGDRSDVIREFVNRNAWGLFLENPWVGVGATGYQEWARQTFGAYQDMSMNVHGEVNRVPAEGGIVGIVIGCAYLLAVAWRTAYFAFVREDRTGSSLERAPLLLLLYVVCYAYAEAIDTAMLVLIGMTGLVAARLPSPSFADMIQRRHRSSRRHRHELPAEGRSTRTGLRVRRRHARSAAGAETKIGLLN
jgi:hypothetical protein